MNIGRLRHRVGLSQASTAQNSFGEQIDTWSNYTTVWGSVRPMKGQELEHAHQISAEVNHVVRIRYNSSVESDHRVTHDSRTFEIVSVINWQERNIFMDLYCKEIA